jgi:hypothetical protein
MSSSTPPPNHVIFNLGAALFSSARSRTALVLLSILLCSCIIFSRAYRVPRFILAHLNCMQLLRTWLVPSLRSAPCTIHKCVLGCSLTLHLAGLVCSHHVCRNMRGFYCSRRLLFSPPRCVVLFAHLCGNQGLTNCCLARQPSSNHLSRISTFTSLGDSHH